MPLTLIMTRPDGRTAERTKDTVAALRAEIIWTLTGPGFLLDGPGAERIARVITGAPTGTPFTHEATGLTLTITPGDTQAALTES
jgi:hypothetical protein